MKNRRLIVLSLIVSSSLLVGACSKANLGIPPAPATSLVEKLDDDSRPLYFVDSVEVDISRIKLDPTNIKSINVLALSYKKELVSTYGQRAKNGVVFVTTKMGK